MLFGKKKEGPVLTPHLHSHAISFSFACISLALALLQSGQTIPQSHDHSHVSSPALCIGGNLGQRSHLKCPEKHCQASSPKRLVGHLACGIPVISVSSSFRRGFVSIWSLASTLAKRKQRWHSSPVLTSRVPVEISQSVIISGALR